MVNPQMEVISGVRTSIRTESPAVLSDSYEAVGRFGTRAIRRAIYAPCNIWTAYAGWSCRPALRTKLQFPTHRDAVIQTHFLQQTNRSMPSISSVHRAAAAHFEKELFLYQLSLALDRRRDSQGKMHCISCGEDNVREALKRHPAFKRTAAQKRVLAEIPRIWKKNDAHESLAAGRCRQRQDDCRALQAFRDCDRKWMPGRIDGSDGNFGGPALFMPRVAFWKKLDTKWNC